MAAARNVSAAHSRTVLPSERNTCESLPIVVVFPVPFTPTTRITSGVPSTFCTGRVFTAFRIASSSSFSRRLSSCTSLISLRSALSRSFPSTSSVVAVPKSAPMSMPSSSSRVERSISLPNETTSSMLSARFSRVRVTACFMRSKKPVFFSSVLPNKV